MYLMIDIIGST